MLKILKLTQPIPMTKRLFAATLIALISFAQAADSSQSFEQSLAVATALVLDVDTSSGYIKVSQSEDGQVHVKGFITVNAPSQKEADRIAQEIADDPPVEMKGSTLQVGDLRKYDIGSSLFQSRSVAISYEIEVPFETEVIMDASSGNLFAQDVQGPVNADASSGNVEVRRVDGAVTIDISSGSLIVSDIAGKLSVDISSGSGVLTNVEGDLEVDISSGNITVTSAITNESTWNLEISSGDITLILPASASFNLQAESSSGTIDLGDFSFQGQLEEKNIKGSIGENPNADVRIETSSGKVQLKQ